MARQNATQNPMKETNHLIFEQGATVPPINRNCTDTLSAVPHQMLEQIQNRLKEIVTQQITIN